MISFDRVTFTYPGEGERLPALCSVSLELAPGESVAVLGANGSGKSTLARLSNGLLFPDSGTVTVDGVDTRDSSRHFDIRSSVGIVFQRPDDQIVGTAVEDDVAFGPENLGLPRSELRARVDAAIAAVGLGGLERREPHLLSGGQKQRLAIAGALAMEPTYLILDEPTSMIDVQGAREVTEAVSAARARGCGVLFITHDLGEALSFDRALVLAEGEVTFDGSIAELLTREGDLERWGLELPRLTELGNRLRKGGVDLPPGVITPERMAAAL